MPANPKTGLIMATYLEAKPLVEKLGRQPDTAAPFPVYHGKDISLVISGIGKTSAAAACAWMCTALAPARIVNLGAAGSNREDLPLGTIRQVNEAFETDRLHFKTGKPFRHLPDVLEGFTTASLATSDQPVINPEQRRKLLSFAEMTDMEGAAVIQTAARFKTRCFLFKFVSDTPGHTTGEEIATHIRLWRQPVIEFLTGKLLPVFAGN